MKRKAIALTVALIVSVLFNLHFKIYVEPTNAILFVGSTSQVTYAQEANGLVEVVGARTKTSKTFDLGNGRYSLDSFLFPIHYQDTQGDWQFIDTELKETTPPWDWLVSDADYTTKIKEDFTAGQIIDFEIDEQHVFLQPMNLQWSNDINQIQQISNPQDVAPTITNATTNLRPTIAIKEGTIKWDNAYGEGIDFIYTTTPARLSKLLTISDLNNLPTPQQYIIDGNNPVLALDFIFTPDSSLSIYVDNLLWDKKSTINTSNVIEFRYNDKTLFGFCPPVHWGSQELPIFNMANTTLEKRGTSLYITIQIPYAWLQTAIYPVYIDPTIDLDVTGLTDDGVNYTGAKGFLTTETQSGCGYYGDGNADDMNNYFRFTGATFNGTPGGVTIDDSYMSWYVLSRANNQHIVHYGVDEDNPSAPTSAAEYEADFLTSASVADTSTYGTGWVNSPSLNTIVQELADTYEIDNEAVMFQSKNDGTETNEYFNHQTRDYSLTYSANFHCEYTLSGAVTPTVVTNTAEDISYMSVTGSGNITATGGANVSSRGFQFGISEFSDNISENGNFGVGVFTLPISELVKDTEYQYRAFAQNSEGLAYGSSENFTTLEAVAPTVIDMAVSNILQYSARFDATISDNGSAGITSIMFEWDIDDSGAPYAYSGNASWDGAYPYFKAEPPAEDGFHLLNDYIGRAHWVRAKATNADNLTGYSEEVAFITKPYNEIENFQVESYSATWIYATWSCEYTQQTHTSIRYDTESYPTDNVTGDYGYWGNGLSVNLTGLLPNTEYKIRAFACAVDEGMGSVELLSPDDITQTTAEVDLAFNAPSEFALTNLGGIGINASWSACENTTGFIIWVAINEYPINGSGYEIAYSSSNASILSCNMTGYNLEYTNYKFIIRSVSSGNFSSDYNYGNIGGDMLLSHLFALLPLLVLLIISLVFYGKGLVHLATGGYGAALAYVAAVNQWEIMFFPIIVITVIIATILFFVAMTRGDWL